MEKLSNPTQEEWWDFWADDLIKAGYILKVVRTEEMGPIELFPGLYKEFSEERVVYAGTPKEEIRTKIRKVCLLKPAVYRPDRVVYWAEKSKGLFFTPYTEIESLTAMPCYYVGQETPDGGYITALDVKSPFGGKNQSDVSFSIKKKWVWEKAKVLTNRSVNYPGKNNLKNLKPYLWPSTFTPSRYFYTEKLTSKRTIKAWVPISLADFITSKT